MAETPSRRLIIVALLVALTVAGCSHGGRGGRNGAGGRRGQPTAPPVPTVTAAPKTVKPQLSIAGIIAPYQNVEITTSLTEPADAVNVNEGDKVSAGETLVQLDTADLQANLDSALKTAQSNDAKVTQAQYNAQLTIQQAPDQVATARAALRQAQQTLAQAQSDLARDRQLVVSGYLAEQAYQQQATTVTNDAAAVRSAEASLSSAQTSQNVNGTESTGLQAANIAAARADASSSYAAAEQYKVQIAKARITSPVDGVIVNRNINPGEYPNGRTLFVIQQISSVYAELNASSADVFKIPNGSRVNLAVSGSTNLSYGGKVVGVLGQVTPGSTNFTVKVLVQNADGRLQAGIPVTGNITLPATSGTGIPTAAFLDDTHTTIMQDIDGKATTRKVTEVASDGTTSIVRGLANGAKLIADGQLGVTDGQQLAQAAQAAPAASGEPNVETSGSPNPSASGHHHRRRQNGGGSGDSSDANP